MARHPTLEVFGNPSARLYLSGRFFSGYGRSLVAAMLAYHVFEVTGSYAALGVMGLVEFLPVIPVSLLGGLIADRYDRRRVVILAQIAAALGAGLLAALSWNEPASQFELYGVAFLLAVAAGFSAPAHSAILPNLVPLRIFQNATVVSANVRHFAFVSAPITMGYAIEPLGFGAPYALAALCYAASVLSLTRLRVPKVLGEHLEISFASVGEGLSFVWNRRAILHCMSLDMFAVIFAGAIALLPVYADEILHVGPGGYGILRSAIAVGTFSMTVILMILRPFERPGRALLVSVALFGLATIAFGLSRSFWLSYVAFMLGGMADQVSMTTRSVIIQLSTPDALRGRVNSVSMIFIGASNELGEAESGFLAALTNAVFSVVAGGVACLGVVGITAARVPELRNWRPDTQDGEPEQPKGREP
ncbi:MAG: MFS transporter [bacterium]|nr:MFS transporter [bacterium]